VEKFYEIGDRVGVQFKKIPFKEKENCDFFLLKSAFVVVVAAVVVVAVAVVVVIVVVVAVVVVVETDVHLKVLNWFGVV
jgi:hypothetical protein